MKKETIKSIVNVAALILVPLYNERHRIKDHEEVQKATALSLKAMDTTKEVGAKTKEKVVHTSHNVAKAAHTVKSVSVGTAQFVSQKAQDTKKKHHYNQQMNLYKKNEKVAQKNEKKLQKEINKLDKNLSKHIEDRRNEENKNINARQKELKKEMKQYKNYEVKLPEEINASNNIQSLSQPFVKNTNVSASATSQKEKTQKTAAKAEENYDNAQLFEKHRQLMAQQIDDR